MLVGPHTETGDELKASAALLPDVNGNIRTSADFGALWQAHHEAYREALSVKASY